MLNDPEIRILSVSDTSNEAPSKDVLSNALPEMVSIASIVTPSSGITSTPDGNIVSPIERFE